MAKRNLPGPWISTPEGVRLSVSAMAQAQGIQGSDPGAMDGLAGKAKQLSATILAIRAVLDRVRHDAPVFGDLAEKMAAEFEAQLLPRLRQAEGALGNVGEVLTWNAQEQRHASESGAPSPAGPKPEYRAVAAAPAGICQVIGEPSYHYSENNRFTPHNPLGESSGIRPRTAREIEMWAKFSSAPGNDPSCCQVRQHLTWDQAFHDRMGPPHSGFPADAKPGVQYEDRDGEGKSYGHRDELAKNPRPSLDQYLTNGKPDALNGDTYRGKDYPAVGAGTPGKFTFQLKVIDVCRNEIPVAVSKPITIDWGQNTMTPPMLPKPQE